MFVCLFDLINQPVFYFFFAVAAPSSACLPPLKNPRLDSETEVLVLPKGGTFVGSPSWEDGGSFSLRLHLDNYQYYGTPVKGSLSARDNIYCGSSSTASHDNDRDIRLSGFGPTMDEIIKKRSNIGPGNTRLADLPYSHSRQHLPFGSSSWNTSAHGPHKFLRSSLEPHAPHAYVTSSMERSSPPASHFESESLSRNRISRDAEPAKYEANFSSFEWKPSARFHPSHEITRRILLKEGSYYPMHDISGKKNVKDNWAKFLYSDLGSSIKNVNVQSNCLEDEEKLLNMFVTGDAAKDNILSPSNDDKVKHDKPRDGAVLEIDGSGKIDIDYDLKVNDHMRSESKAFKCFQSALIGYAKELLKPAWRGGFLSKDAHKLIVKKAVDKVLRKLQPHQIPNTAESVQSYLCSTQPRLAKLVEVSFLH